MGTNELVSVHIVLTTYHTVSADWKAQQETGDSPLFAVRWKRIILDEGLDHLNWSSSVLI
jgi:hypothetical protein